MPLRVEQFSVKLLNFQNELCGSKVYRIILKINSELG